MAKGKENKSAAIREALKAHRGKTPTQIAEMLKGQGYDVTPAYVSNIKFHSKHRRKSRTPTLTAVARTTRRGRRSSAASGFAGIEAGLAFVKAVGGLEAARAALQTIEQVSAVVR
jgi:hypothetical protein